MPAIRFLPAKVSVDAEEGASLLETARRAGYMLQSECGGQGTCRRCKVRLLSGEVFMTAEANLSERERSERYVLACIACVVNDLEVEIPPESELRFTSEALTPELTPGENPGVEIRARGYKIDPRIDRLPLEIPAPTLQDNSSDFDRLCRKLNEAGIEPPYRADLSVLQTLSDQLRHRNGRVDAFLHRSNLGIDIVDIQSGKTPVYGLALDVGTTTVFGRLIDLESGEVAAESSDYNAQISCGGDIIHRIVFAEKPNGQKKLQKLVLETANGLIADLSERTGANRPDIKTCTLAGNTTMQHLFLGLNPKYIRQEPYVPGTTHFPPLKAAEIGIDILPNAPVLLTPSVASYVGGDITSGLLAANVHRSPKLTLYVDLGTNGEIALGNSDWLTACACSAGPAFEGSGVKCGMRALPGGINKVMSDATDATLTFGTIGGGTPRGICGSGMIDLLAELRATNRITARGKLNQEADPKRIRKRGRKFEILLIKGTDEKGKEDIVVTEPDLDNLIRTKGAIFAGIMTLCKGVGLDPMEIERVVIAGAFGRYLDIENAIRIGMLPDLPRDRFEYIGNGSLRGAGLALLSKKMYEEMHEIARMITYFELSSWPAYMDEFMAALFLPHTDGGLFPSVG